MCNCLNEMETTSTHWKESEISLIELKKCKGYQTLLQAVEKDIVNDPKDTRYVEKLNWITERVLHYAEKLNLPASELLNKWEEKRTYWYMNYYQDYNMPKIEGDNIFVFETVDDFLKSIPSKKFICPCCKGITTNPYECNSGIKKDNKTCDWKVYGLFDLGHVTVFVKDKLQFDKIFTPVDWRKD